MYDNDLDRECNICKFKREISHVHQGVLISGTPATCTQEGSKDYYTCTCEQAFEDEACTKPIANLDSWKVIPSKGHTWSESYLAVNADAGKHYHVCTVCGARDAGEAHTWNANAAQRRTTSIVSSAAMWPKPPPGIPMRAHWFPARSRPAPRRAAKAYYTCTCQQNFETKPAPS